MNINKINPYIRHASYSVLSANRIITTRSILDYELVCIDEGRLLLIYDGAEYICSPGDIVLLHPGVEHSFIVLDADLSQPHIHFDLVYDELSENRPISFKSRAQMTANELHMIVPDELSTGAHNPLLNLSDKAGFTELFFSLIDEYQSNGKQSTFSVRIKMIQLIERIMVELVPERMCQPASRSADFELEMIKHYIDANHHSIIDLPMLETQFHYSRSFIAHRFKACYGVSIMKYYSQKRMETAYEMLKTHSVTAVAEALSFSSIYAFSRAFKHAYGFPPGDVKKQNNIREENGKRRIR